MNVKKTTFECSLVDSLELDLLKFLDLVIVN